MTAVALPVQACLDVRAAIVIRQLLHRGNVAHGKEGNAGHLPIAVLAQYRLHPAIRLHKQCVCCQPGIMRHGDSLQVIRHASLEEERKSFHVHSWLSYSRVKGSENYV